MKNNTYRILAGIPERADTWQRVYMLQYNCHWYETELAKNCFKHSSCYRSWQVGIIGFLYWITDYQQHATSRTQYRAFTNDSPAWNCVCFAGFSNYDRIITVICFLGNGYVHSHELFVCDLGREAGNQISFCAHRSLLAWNLIALTQHQVTIATNRRVLTSSSAGSRQQSRSWFWSL